MQNIVIRIISFIIGLIIVSFGVSLTIKADLGAGAWDALNVGLSENIAFTVGTWVILVGLILIVLNAILMKSKPNFFSIITIVLVGSFIDFWLIIGFSGWEPEGVMFRFSVLILGLIALAFGVSTYLQADFAPIPIDNLMIAIQSRTGFSLMVSKTIGEISAMIFAFIFGGPIGIGTILITFLIGPLIQVFYPRLEKMMLKYNVPKPTS